MFLNGYVFLITWNYILLRIYIILLHQCYGESVASWAKYYITKLLKSHLISLKTSHSLICHYIERIYIYFIMSVCILRIYDKLYIILMLQRDHIVFTFSSGSSNLSLRYFLIALSIFTEFMLRLWIPWKLSTDSILPT